MKKLIGIALLTLMAFQSNAQKEKDYLVTISTEFGDMTVVLYDGTPKHKENFIKLAEEGFYDSTTFHRVISNFMIQGGDPNSKDNNPNNDGMGGPGYTIPAEFDTNYTHIRGALAAARTGGRSNPQKRSSGSQFYIVHPQKGAHFLNKNYTVFGQVVEGFEVIDKIAAVDKNSRDRPTKNIYMKMSVKKVSKKKVAKLLKKATSETDASSMSN